MQRANDLTGIFVVSIATLAAVLAGCTERDPPVDSGRLAAFDSSAVASNAMPEVVITAPRPRSKTILLSERATRDVPPR
jgi:ABC-type uncharacterized transport system auxiliary subunit